MKHFLLISFIFLSQAMAHELEPKVLKTAVLGLGGRGLGLLEECLLLQDKTQTSLQVVAICDENPKEPLHHFFTQYLTKMRPEICDTYQNVLKGASTYRDTPEQLKKLFTDHPDLDLILITSSNDRHFDHLVCSLQNSSCPNIFIEKPLFRRLDELEKINDYLDDRDITIGLTLRYANMTRIVAQKLKEYQALLGPLKRVKSWEDVDFGHAFSIIMMNWRRYQSLSGGMLLDKSVHDLDLALYFLEILGVHPTSIEVSTDASHDIFKKSNQAKFLSWLLEDETMAKRFEHCAKWTFQRIVPYIRDESGAFDWKAIMEAFFKDFPENDHFSQSDIIFDRHKIAAKMTDENGSDIDFELIATLKDTLGHRRGSHFTFENGEIAIDIMGGKMQILLNHAEPIEVDLESDGRMHAGGDRYVAYQLLGALPKGHHKATFHNPALQLSTLLGLVSEYQAQHRIQKPIQIRQVDGKWKIELP